MDGNPTHFLPLQTNRTHTQTYPHIYTHTHTYTNTLTHTHTHQQPPKHPHTHTRTHTHTHIRTPHTYTHLSCLVFPLPFLITWPSLIWREQISRSLLLRCPGKWLSALVDYVAALAPKPPVAVAIYTARLLSGLQWISSSHSCTCVSSYLLAS